MEFENYVSTKQEKIAKLARIHPDLSFTSLAHHIDLKWLYEAHRRTRKEGAPGVDGQNGFDYNSNIGENLRSLLERAKSGNYKAPPVKRHYIPKDGKGKEMRPIGMPTYEDKVLQRAVVMLLEPIFEEDFYKCSYGFRPGISAHNALNTLQSELMRMGGGWIIDLDIRKYFDTVDHSYLREIVKSRVRDGVITRLIGKWLKAGVMEGSYTSYPGVGVPQGGVISPLLSNIYLNEVIDKWFMEIVKPRMKGRVVLVRYADDVVMGFEYQADALKVMNVLPKRLGKYGLTLHPDKTKLLHFRNPSRTRAEKREHMDFLGFRFYWGRTRKRNWVIKWKTIKDRLKRALYRINLWCKQHRHERIYIQYQKLRVKLIGHYNYYGLRFNYCGIKRFYEGVQKSWQKWLSRRSWKAKVTWNRFNQILKVYVLPRPKLNKSVT